MQLSNSTDVTMLVAVYIPGQLDPSITQDPIEQYFIHTNGLKSKPVV